MNKSIWFSEQIAKLLNEYRIKFNKSELQFVDDLLIAANSMYVYGSIHIEDIELEEREE